MKLEELLKQATPLPLSNAGETVYAVNSKGVSDEWASCAAGEGLHHKKAARALLIAHAVNILPKLVDALELARNRLEEREEAAAENGCKDLSDLIGGERKSLQYILSEANHVQHEAGSTK